jgi:hypothetical protein
MGMMQILESMRVVGKTLTQMFLHDDLEFDEWEG